MFLVTDAIVTEATNSLKEKAVTTATGLINNPKVLIFGIIFIILAVIILFFLKNILLNSIVGVVGFLVCNFILGIKLPIWATIVVSAIFGVAGLGSMLILKFFGVF